MRPWSDLVHAVDSSGASTRDMFGKAAQGQLLRIQDYHLAARLHSGFLTLLRPRIYDDFNLYRVSQAKRRSILDRVTVAMGPGHVPLCSSAPTHLQEACQEAFGRAETRYLLPMKDALAAIGARELRRVGVEVPGVGVVKPHYGVFAPTKPAYCNLLASFLRRRNHFSRGLDVGTGTGVLALVMAKSGCVDRVVATDVSKAAVACAKENVAAHGLQNRVYVEEADLFPTASEQQSAFDLMVFNPPWLPAKANDAAPVDGAVFDPNGATLARFLKEAPLRLAPGGIAAVILSNLAELLRLRAPAAEYLAQHNWRVELQLDRFIGKPVEARRRNALAQSAHEIVSLFVVRPV